MDSDVTIVGAGAVGLAIAAELTSPSRSVLVIERHGACGRETSSRNSEVIHAGLYYPPGSLMATLCVEGNRRLYEFCARHYVPCSRLGKIVVATNDVEEERLAELQARGTANGAPLEWLSAAEVARLEPHVRATAALLSPTTGIISAHDLVDRLAAIARDRGASFAMRSTVVAVHRSAHGFEVTTSDASGGTHVHSTRILINAAGLGADDIARRCGIDVAAAGYELHWCKGDYFSVRREKAGLVRRLVYPVKVPGAPGIGIHVTLDLSGRMRLGPDATYVKRGEMSFAVDPAKRAAFAESVHRFLPFIDAADLEPEMAGIRPKLSGPGEPQRDFVIADETARRLPGLVTLIGIESPGLTCSLAIARHVREMVE